MISKYRELFNAQFTEKKYQEFKDDIASDFNYIPTFRLGETPFFIRSVTQIIGIPISLWQ